MRLTESQLRRAIRRYLQEKAGPDDVYGQFLFGDARGLDEPDTSEESELQNKFGEFFNGFPDDLGAEDVKKLIDLRNEDKYTDVLDVPAKYRQAWRVIELSALNSLGIESKPDLEKPQVFKTKKVMQLYRSSANSWTVSDDALMRLIDDKVTHERYVVILCVDLERERKNFILNPEVTGVVNPFYNWQAEIWQVSSVVCDRVVVIDTAAPHNFVGLEDAEEAAKLANVVG